MGPTRSQIDIEALLAKLNPPSTPSDAVSKLPRLASRLKNRDFATGAAIIAGMATERAFHAHQVRLDWAIRVLATSAGGGKAFDRVALDRLLNQDFSKLRIDAQEDPIEQPFVGRVVTRHGEFRFVAGIYDQSVAFTDLIVSAFDTLNGPEWMNPLGRALALLTLSDALAQRAEEDVWTLGPDNPVARIDLPSDAVLTHLSKRVIFTAEDLSHYGVDPAALESFRLTEADREMLASATVGASPLERKPLWRTGTDWIVVSPGAISTAVRACLIDGVVERQMQRQMAVRMLSIQHDRLTECGFLKEGTADVVNHGGQPALDYVVELSAGRFCHVLETIDDFEDWPERAFGSDRPCSPVVASAFAKSISQARATARDAQGFREGFSLWLAGGWGSGRSIPAHLIDRFPDWPVIIIEPGDACVLGLGESGTPATYCGWRP